MPNLPSTSVAQYGDQKKLASLASGLKQSQGTSGPLVERTPVGRPAGKTAQPEAQEPIQEPVIPSPGLAIPPEHLALINQTAQAKRAAMIAGQLSQYPDAGPWVQSALQQAWSTYVETSKKTRVITPFFSRPLGTPVDATS